MIRAINEKNRVGENVSQGDLILGVREVFLSKVKFKPKLGKHWQQRSQPVLRL